MTLNDWSQYELFPKHQVAEMVGDGWVEFAYRQLNKTRMQKLARRIARERNLIKIYPEKEDVFRAYKLTPYAKVRVVIVGQDPYHNGQADGLAFSSRGERTPKSLLNIFKEVGNSTGKLPNYNQPDLTRWATQGVFLINTALTVPKGDPGGHKDLGWEEFVGNTLSYIGLAPVPVVYMLWGSHAKSFKKYINTDLALILEASHPSPLSADRGFFGCDHFKLCNDYLVSHNFKPIDWT